IWHISVNDVAPDGTSVVRSTGALVSTRRVMDDTRSRRLSNGDYTDAEPSLRSVDTAPVIANQPHTVDNDLLSWRATEKLDYGGTGPFRPARLLLPPSRP
ncbi:hypothetical protein ABZ331_39610, partial [Nocardia brasiliensis]